MEYVLRELKASDIGIVCKIINGIGLKEFKGCINLGDFIPNEVDENGKPKMDAKTLERIGLDIMLNIGSIILENVPNVQKDVDTFLASLTNQKIQDIQDMGFVDYGDLIIEVVRKKEFKDFFEHVMKLFNRSDS